MVNIRNPLITLSGDPIDTRAQVNRAQPEQESLAQDQAGLAQEAQLKDT